MIKIRRYFQYQMGGLVLLIGLAFTLGGYALMSKVAEDEAEATLRLITNESGAAMNHLLLPATTLLKLLQCTRPENGPGKRLDGPPFCANFDIARSTHAQQCLCRRPARTASIAASTQG
jgi:hypothetical protein